MKAPQTLLQILAVAILAGSCGKAAPEDEVLGAWAEFKEATLSGAGDIAAGRVTNATHEYFAEVRELALNADRSRLEALALAQECTVLMLRARLARAELEPMTGRKLYAHSVTQGWVGKNDTGSVGICDIQVVGRHASAMTTKVDAPTGLKMHFIREDGAWRVDVMNLMKYGNMAIDSMHKKSGASEEEFLATMVRTVTGRKLTDELWNPMR